MGRVVCFDGTIHADAMGADGEYCQPLLSRR